MLTLNIISAVAAGTNQDPNTIYVIVGVVIFFFILMAAASGSGVKTKKKYCPYCSRQVNYPSRPNSPKAQQNSHLNRRLRNDPIIKSGGKMYCPHCRAQL
jgi:hypothetical protein